MPTDSSGTVDVPSSPVKPVKLWTRDFTLVTLATILGAAGGIAGEFALSFFVFDETGSTLASALVIAIQLVPHVFVPLIVSPFMDRLPRKAFLVAGDLACGIAYAALGFWLARSSFSYLSYLVVSLALACLEAIDSLAWTSIYPEVIPQGAEQRGYAVSSMLFDVLVVVMTPFAAVLLDTIGVARLLMIQGGLAVLAAIIESFACVKEHERAQREEGGLALWASDIREAATWLAHERGMRGLMSYMAVTNGIGTGYAPILIAFFRTTPGFSAALYALFSGVECIGRALGSAVQYKVKVPRERRFGLCLFVYLFYDTMDTVLLWLPYPLMLLNRMTCGFLGSNSYILRESAMQRYIPEHMRSRVNAFQGALVTAACSVCAVGVGALGELLDYRICLTICGAAAIVASLVLVWLPRTEVRKVFEAVE